MTREAHFRSFPIGQRSSRREPWMPSLKVLDLNFVLLHTAQPSCVKGNQ